MDVDLPSLLVGLAAAITALGVILVAAKKVGSFIRRFVHVFDVIVGREASDGIPALPGISARLAAIEYELKPNGGASLKDQVNRLELWTTGHSLVHAELNDRYVHKTN